MVKQMCWLPKLGSSDGQKILHLRISPNHPWQPYTAFREYAVPDYRVSGGSKGWATYQKLRSIGWELLPSQQEEPLHVEPPMSA